MNKKGEKLVKRMSTDKEFTLDNLYANNPLYRAMYSELSEEYESYELLRPVEIWGEAVNYSKAIFAAEYPIFQIESIYNKIKEDYYGIKKKQQFFETDFDRNDNGKAASEVMWCIYAILSPLVSEQQTEINNKLLSYLDSDMMKIADRAIETALNDKDYNMLFFLDKPRAWGHGIAAHQPETISQETKETETRTHGVQMKPLLEMMNSLWGRLRLTDLSRTHRAELLSIMTGWSKDTIYNELKANDDRSHYDLSEKWHSEDIKRINNLLPQLGVKRAIKIATDQK